MRKIWFFGKDLISEELIHLGNKGHICFQKTLRSVVIKACQFFRGVFEDKKNFVQMDVLTFVI